MQQSLDIKVVSDLPGVGEVGASDPKDVFGVGWDGYLYRAGYCWSGSFRELVRYVVGLPELLAGYCESAFFPLTHSSADSWCNLLCFTQYAAILIEEHLIFRKGKWANVGLFLHQQPDSGRR